jgi:CheY-like chemotaxis protein
MSGKTILIVEDEALAALEIKETLEKEGYNVPEPIASGDELLNAVLRHNPVLVIMDIKLKSFIDGITAVQRLKLLKEIPVIYLTAYQNPEVRERAMKTNPAAYLVKPFRENDLLMQVEAALTS